MSSTTEPHQYRGRFAPSPTGPLHIGSLLAAVGSYLHARSQKGIWLLRIEDIDPPREQAGASDNILKTLEGFGFEWDEAVVFQSHRSEAYEAAVQQLIANDHAYFCQCSRKQIAQTAKMGLNGYIYPRTCFHLTPPLTNGSIRFFTDSAKINFHDGLRGKIEQHVAKESGDFILKRADGLFAYQLAVVIDDQWQRITDVVRGSDLLNLTPGQLLLQQTLKLQTPNYHHLPVINNPLGQKLSKQTGATGLDIKHAPELLFQCLRFLGQNPLEELRQASNFYIWQWALENWDSSKIPSADLTLYDDKSLP